MTEKWYHRERVNNRLDCHYCKSTMGAGYLAFGLYMEWETRGGSTGRTYWFCTRKCQDAWEDNVSAAHYRDTSRDHRKLTMCFSNQ